MLCMQTGSVPQAAAGPIGWALLVVASSNAEARWTQIWQMWSSHCRSLEAQLLQQPSSCRWFWHQLSQTGSAPQRGVQHQEHLGLCCPWRTCRYKAVGAGMTVMTQTSDQSGSCPLPMRSVPFFVFAAKQ